MTTRFGHPYLSKSMPSVEILLQQALFSAAAWFAVICDGGKVIRDAKHSAFFQPKCGSFHTAVQYCTSVKTSI